MADALSVNDSFIFSLGKNFSPECYEPNDGRGDEICASYRS